MIHERVRMMKLLMHRGHSVYGVVGDMVPKVPYVKVLVCPRRDYYENELVWLHRLIGWKLKRTEYQIFWCNVKLSGQLFCVVRQKSPCFVCVAHALAVLDLTIDLTAARNCYRPADATVKSLSSRTRLDLLTRKHQGARDIFEFLHAGLVGLPSKTGTHMCEL